MSKNDIFLLYVWSFIFFTYTFLLENNRMPILTGVFMVISLATAIYQTIKATHPNNKKGT